MKDKMSGDSLLIVELGLALLLMGAFSVFFSPAYAKAFDRITEVIAFAFTSAVVYKWGRSMPQQAGDPKPGQTSESTTSTTSAVPPVPAPEAPPKA